MSGNKQGSNNLFMQTGECCKGFLQNQIALMQAVRQALEEYDKEEAKSHLDQILEYYKSKLEEVAESRISSNR